MEIEVSEVNQGEHVHKGGVHIAVPKEYCGDVQVNYFMGGVSNVNAKRTIKLKEKRNKLTI